MRSGDVPWATKCWSLSIKSPVLPEPGAPSTIRGAVVGAVTSSFCCPEVCAHPSRLIPTYDSRRLGRVEIRIGIANSSREIVFDTTKNAEEVEKSISSSVADGDDAVMRLEDDKGHIYLVPVRTLAYVEILKEPARKVGFAP